jgi:hypothetical protein
MDDTRLHARIRAERDNPLNQMNRKSCFAAAFFLLGAVLNVGYSAQAQTSSPQTQLSVHWEELTGPNFLEEGSIRKVLQRQFIRSHFEEG